MAARMFRRGGTPVIIAAVLLGIMISAMAWFARQQADAILLTRHVLEINQRLTAAFDILQDAEANLRGYLVFEDEKFLAGFDGIDQRLNAEFEGLMEAASGESQQREAIQTLQGIATQRLKILTGTAARRRAGMPLPDMIRTSDGTGRRAMSDARALIQRINAEESRILDERLTESGNTARLLQILVLLALTVVSVMAIADARFSVRRRRQLEAARDALQLSNAMLKGEVEQRARVEDELRQSQKMEALGQLTGGIAHDFNNMLAIIMSAMQIQKRRLEKGDHDVMKFVDAAMDGAHRAAMLTQRLLAFSRRQALEPKMLDVNALITSLSEMLASTLGESARLKLTLSPTTWPIVADAHQLENAIVNLAVNARDAMASGGMLTIATTNIRRDGGDDVATNAVGRFVTITVSDTGSGMAPDVVTKAFDPFFTTKKVGQGTGLGLSQVYGFIKQSGGSVRIISAVGEGTTVVIEFPAAQAEGATVDDTGTALPATDVVPVARPGETILVLEDELAVRELTVQSLRDLGYTVLAAAHGPAALDLLDQHPAIALAFTDVVMPIMNGPEFAAAALVRRPKLRVLYTTGYARDASPLLRDVKARVLPKPFTVEQMAHAVRDSLDNR